MEQNNINVSIQTNKHTLYKGDCLEVMKDIPNESVDLVVTDPPYKITARGNGGNSGGMFQKKEVNSGKVFKNNDIDISDWINDIYRILKPQSHCYIMTNNKNIYHYLDIINNKSEFNYIKNLIWVKDNKIMGQTYMSQFEYIIMLRKGAHRKINNCGVSDVLNFKNKKSKNEEGKTIHDTEKPVGLLKVLVENSSNENDIIFDPFAGLFSLTEACIDTNREFIGCELDDSYFNIGKKRIADILEKGELK